MNRNILILTILPVIALTCMNELLFPRQSNEDFMAQEQAQFPLIAAVRKALMTNDISPVKAALSGHAANINAQNEHGLSALMLAAQASTSLQSPEVLHKIARDIAELLIKNGADVNVKGKDDITALEYAVILDHLGVVELLLNNGADVNYQDNYPGMTALMHAALGEDKNIVQLLLDNGADITAKDFKGRTALDLAIEEGHKLAKISSHAPREFFKRKQANPEIIKILQEASVS